MSQPTRLKFSDITLVSATGAKADIEITSALFKNGKLCFGFCNKEIR